MQILSHICLSNWINDFNISAELPVLTSSQVMPEVADIGTNPPPPLPTIKHVINISDDDDFMENLIKYPAPRDVKRKLSSSLASTRKKRPSTKRSKRDLHHHCRLRSWQPHQHRHNQRRPTPPLSAPLKIRVTKWSCNIS